MYHQIGPDPHPAFAKYTVTPRAFALQMRLLALLGYTAITLDQLLAARAGEAALPRRPIVLTFDDGFMACIQHAVPILRRHGLTATFYLVAGLMGRPSRWIEHTRGTTFPLIDWSAARDLLALGFACGSHTLSHPHLTHLSPAKCREELAGARHALEDHLGRPIAHLAYPFGDYDGQVRDIAAAAGYRSASSVRIGLSAPDDDVLALHRVPVDGDDSLVDFAAKLVTAHTAREAAQALLHGVAATRVAHG
jgi:peptidoglycan/xylan/chitin deacetylase (PgdA/CDA1 family)